MIISARNLKTFYCLILKRSFNTIVPVHFNCVINTSRFFRSGICADTECNDDNYESNNVSIKKYEILKKIYQFSDEEIKKLFRKTSPLFHVHLANINKNVLFLREIGVDKNTVITYPWVLGYNSELFPSVYRHLKHLHNDINVSLPLVALSYRKLVSISYQLQKEYAIYENGKIHRLSELFECEPEEMIQIILKRPFILSMSSERILHILNVLKDGGVALTDIKKDMRIFRYNSEVMKSRLAEASKKNVHSLKPWVLRCEEEIFQRFLEIKIKSREFLGDCKTVREYLAMRLECQDASITRMFRKVPQLKHISVLKVKELLDYLYNNSYVSSDVILMPRILTRSVNTIKERINELEKLGLVHPSLNVLCKSAKEYKNLVSKLRHNIS